MEKQLDTELEEKDLPEVITEDEITTIVNPGDEVPGGFTYSNNAVIQNKSLNLKDANGTDIANRYVSIGDKITVLKIDADKQLALVQYPSGSIVREGYITNDTSAIKYLNEYDWVNGSTSEPVYETESSSDGKWGTLSPYEKATRLYKKDSRTCVVYDTSKGPLTKSGFVDYEGGSSNGGSDSNNGIKPGEIVPGGFTYPNNAVIQNDSLYLRDENGNQIAGRSVSVGDEITVLDVGYTKQLALIQYPTSSGVVQGYVTNATNIISYKNPYNWVNGSTPEPVYSSATSTDSSYGTLSPREAATLLYKEGNRYHIVYDTNKGPLTKSGYVDYEGTGETGGAGVDTDITIPVISHSQIEIQQYGTSGKGRPLNVYKIGNGSKAVFAGFAIHGWEDNWDNDGLALVKLANALALKIADYKAQNGGLHSWTVYIAPCMNPDGVIVSGTTGPVGATSGPGNNGIGRCAVTTRIDLNRCFPDGFVPQYTSRNYTGPTSLGAPEAVALKNYVQNLNSSFNEVVVIDAHGWLGCVYGNSSIASYFTSQFGISYKGGSAGGYFSYWAGNLSKTRAILLEYPQATYSYDDVINKNYIGKTYNAIINMIGGNPGTDNGSGNNGSDSTNGDEAYSATGTVINVTTTLNVREQASTSSNIVGTLSAGETVTITAKNGAWYKISSPKVGYVHSDYISITTSGDTNNGDEAYSATGTVINVTTTLNVREQASTSSNIVGTLSAGETVKITAKNGAWYKISSPKAGYVHSDYIKLDENINNDNELNKEAEKRVKEFLSQLFGFNGQFEFNKSIKIPLMNATITFEAGFNPFINDDAALKFDIINGEIDDSTVLGGLIKNGFNFLEIFSDSLKEKFTKFTKEIGNAEVEFQIESDFSISINSTLLFKSDEFNSGVKIFFNMNIKPDIKKLTNNLLDKIKELIELLKNKVNSLLLSVIVVLLIVAIIFTPVDEILVGLTAIVSAVSTITDTILSKIIQYIFHYGNGLIPVTE